MTQEDKIDVLGIVSLVRRAFRDDIRREIDSETADPIFEKIRVKALTISVAEGIRSKVLEDMITLITDTYRCDQNMDSDTYRELKQNLLHLIRQEDIPRDYLMIVRRVPVEDQEKWIVDEDSIHLLEDDGGNAPIQELTISKIRPVKND